MTLCVWPRPDAVSGGSGRDGENGCCLRVVLGYQEDVLEYYLLFLSQIRWNCPSNTASKTRRVIAVLGTAAVAEQGADDV